MCVCVGIAAIWCEGQDKFSLVNICSMLCVNPSQYLLLSQVVLANKEIIAAKSNYHIGISVQAQQGKGLPNSGYQEIDVFASMNSILTS